MRRRRSDRVVGRWSLVIGRWSMVVGCWLLAFGTASASVVTATVTSYNSAELAGDVAVGMEVFFENTNHSKGTVTAGNEAVLTITNIPKGALTKVELSMKSNAKSGAGEVTVTLANQQIAKIENSNFCDWPGVENYSSTFVPVTFEGNWSVSTASDLSVDIKASANSIALEKVTVTFIETAPEPRVVTLSWLDANGNRKTTDIAEKTAGKGVELPEAAVKAVEDWSFAGWSREMITELYTSEPALLKAGEKFYPQMNTTLFAVYRDAPEVTPIPQATEFVSGEYAIATKGLDTYYLLTGEVSGKVAAGSKVELEVGKDGNYCIPAGYMSVYCRYQLEFENDSVTIQYGETGSYIGHNKTTLTDKKAKWAVAEAKNHSIELSFGRVEKSSGAEGRVLWLNGVDKVYEATLLRLGQDYEYMLLFDVSDAPTSSPKTKWTSCPFGAEGIESVESPTSKSEKLIRDGQMIIRVDGIEYNITGKRIQ